MAIQSNLQELAKGGYLKIAEEEELEFLVSALSLMARFWISEAAISFRQMSPPEQIRHYLTLVTRLFLPYCSAKAKREIWDFCDGL